MSKLVQKSICSQNTLLTTQKNSNIIFSFTCEVWQKETHSYLMVAQDASRYLNCDLVLEVVENTEEYGEKTVICHFPTISDEELDKFVWEDEFLLGMILIQFQMNILKQLLSFCDNQNIKNLIIQVDESQTEDVRIYSQLDQLVMHKDKIPFKEGISIQMIIPVKLDTLNSWVNFMDETNQDFRQILWHDQRTNPAIRHYLKCHPLG